jgi:hypothetical protein
MRSNVTMSAPEQQDLLFSDEIADFQPPRSDKRERVVHAVEYSQYPRIDAGQRTHVGYTRDLSQGGLCFGAKTANRVGDLIRVTLRGVDGGVAYEGLGRVAWCEARENDEYWVGVAKLADTRRQMRSVPSRTAQPERMSA